MASLILLGEILKTRGCNVRSNFICWVLLEPRGVDLGSLLGVSLKSWGGVGCEFGVLGWKVAGTIEKHQK